jgi:hypothetical protein
VATMVLASVRIVTIVAVVPGGQCRGLPVLVGEAVLEPRGTGGQRAVILGSRDPLRSRTRRGARFPSTATKGSPCKTARTRLRG